MGMEMTSPFSPLKPKKLWKMVKIIFNMLKKGITKTKLLLHLHITILKRGKISSKAIENLMLYHHYAAFVDRAHNISVIPRATYGFNYNENFDEITIDDVFEILNNSEKVEGGSPLTLPGFGRTPVVRQLRVTDSPFPLKDDDHEDINDYKIDKAAEEFIMKFHKELMKQQMMASLASPSPYNMRA